MENGTYALALPKGWDGRAALPALVFFHGYGSSAGATLRRDDLRAELDRLGWLLIAPNGLVPPGRGRTSWSHEGSPSRTRDEAAFTHAVLGDVAERLPLDRGRVFVGGFSQGSSMAWHLACLDAAPYAGFVALSGAFWDPMPEDCPAPPRRLVHFHGLTDHTVPLEGRPIGGRFRQSDAFASLAVLRRSWGCPSMPDGMTVAGGLRCRTWPACGRGGALRFCLHDGGHEAPKGWAKEAFDWLEGDQVDAPRPPHGDKDPHPQTDPTAARTPGAAARAR